MVPRAKITELIKQTSDAQGFKQVALFIPACVSWPCRLLLCVITMLHALIRGVRSQVLSHVASYAGCAALFGVGQAIAFMPLSVLSMIGMAFVMSFNFMALHETVHRSAFKSRMWNDVFMHVSGFFTMRPVCSSRLLSSFPRICRSSSETFSPPYMFSCGITHTHAPPYIRVHTQAQHYFYYHWAHHKFTGNPEMDSELIPSALDMDVSTWPGYLLYVSGLPFWFDAVRREAVCVVHV